MNRQSKNLIIAIIFVLVLLAGFFIFNYWLRSTLCSTANLSQARLNNDNFLGYGTFSNDVTYTDFNDMSMKNPDTVSARCV